MMVIPAEDKAVGSTYSVAQLKELIAEKLGPRFVPQRFKIITDTSDFFKVDYNDVCELDGIPYLMLNYTREGRFGLDDEPKYWVRKAVDLLDGSRKIIKLVFHEEIEARIGDIVFKCVRSPSKEADILKVVKGHPNFMQGTAVLDEAGNIIRILENIRGKQLDQIVNKLNEDHEEYFFQHLPGLLNIFTGLVEAIRFLHDHGHKHGDIRRDHILHDRENDCYRWIDFDYDYMHMASMFSYDLFGLGNILIFLVGGGDLTIQQLTAEKASALQDLSADDMNIIFNNRVANIQKIYPYVPDVLNYILLHFSNGANLYYENAEQLLEDLGDVQINA
jgi:hypothetical protein